LLLGREQRRGPGGNLERQPATELDLREEHIDGITRFQAQGGENGLGLFETPGGDTDTKNRVKP
jgi:hypothetical protein